MPCRASKSATTALQTLPYLWITDEVLSQAFARFLRVSHAHRRYGSNVPGPLEAHRRTAKRRHGLAAVASGAAPSGQDLSALFGFRLEDAPRPDFERGWRWQPPSYGTLPKPASRSKDHGDWRPWMRSPVDVGRSLVGTQERDETFERFLEIPEDIEQRSKQSFEDLLANCRDESLLGQADVRPMLEFLQGTANEPDARLTLRLVQWLAHRSLSAECSRDLAVAIGQKISLDTMHEDEVSAVMLELLNRRGVSQLVTSILDLLPQARLPSLVARVTAAVSNASTGQQSEMKTWLDCLRACSASSRSAHRTSGMWASVYTQLSQHYRISDLTDHFYWLDQQDLARVILKYWVPRLLSNQEAGEGVSAFTLPEDITWRSSRGGYKDEVSGAWLSQAVPNNPLVDLIASLAACRIPYATLLEDVTAYWKVTLDPTTMVKVVYQLRANRPAIEAQAHTIAPIIETFAQTGYVKAALSLLDLAHPIPIGEHRQLLVKIVEERKTHGRDIWRLVDRWAEEDGVPLMEKARLGTPLPQEIAETVHKIAYAWAASPHISANVAYRRVWECYCFLTDLHSPLPPDFSRALLRAGVINFVQQHKPLSKKRVQFVLAVVERVEGVAIMQQADEMLFDYWMLHRNKTRYKPSRQRKLENVGMQYLEDGSKVFRPWAERKRFGPPAALERELELFHAGEAVEADRPEDVATIIVEARPDEYDAGRPSVGLEELSHAISEATAHPTAKRDRVSVGDDAFAHETPLITADAAASPGISPDEIYRPFVQQNAKGNTRVEPAAAALLDTPIKESTDRETPFVFKPLGLSTVYERNSTEIVEVRTATLDEVSTMEEPMRSTSNKWKLNFRMDPATKALELASGTAHQRPSSITIERQPSSRSARHAQSEREQLEVEGRDPSIARSAVSSNRPSTAHAATIASVQSMSNTQEPVRGSGYHIRRLSAIPDLGGGDCITRRLSSFRKPRHRTASSAHVGKSSRRAEHVRGVEGHSGILGSRTATLSSLDSDSDPLTVKRSPIKRPARVRRSLRRAHLQREFQEDS